MDDIQRLKKLKKIPYDKYGINDIKFLKKQGIINGVGAEWQGKITRSILTKGFEFLEYERHDIAFWKGGTINHFHSANWGLLKYSFITMAKEYEDIHFNYKYSKIWRTPLFILTAMIRTALIIYAYIVVESKAGKKAFNFKK